MPVQITVLRATMLALLAAILLAACTPEPTVPADDLFPAKVGEFLRTSGPGPDPVTGVDQAVYEGGSGIVILRIKQVGADNVEQALSELPPTATKVGYDSALGQRSGVFFLFSEEYHAAWGNGDWVFVISASTETSRVSFLSSYGY
jgi:hypothetical protein